jgi:hypothetical protein
MPNGYIRKCHFTHRQDGDTAFLHPIAYTVEGFLRSGLALSDDRYLDVVRPTVRMLQRRFEIERRMPASHYDRAWRPVTRYAALDACCQIAALWFRFSRATDDLLYASSAFKMMDLLRRLIDTAGRDAGARGGIAGSFPVFGHNQAFACVNWAPKYFIDASLLELDVRRRLSA